MSRAIRVGDRATLTRAFSAQDVKEYAVLSTDRNPIHLDAEYAATTTFGRPIVHGMLISSLFSALLGQHLPGEGAIYLGQELKFKAPVFIDQEVVAQVEVASIRDDKPIVELSTTCMDKDGKLLVVGSAVCLVPWLSSAA